MKHTCIHSSAKIHHMWSAGPSNALESHWHGFSQPATPDEQRATAFCPITAPLKSSDLHEITFDSIYTILKTLSVDKTSKIAQMCQVEAPVSGAIKLHNKALRLIWPIKLLAKLFQALDKIVRGLGRAKFRFDPTCHPSK